MTSEEGRPYDGGDRGRAIRSRRSGRVALLALAAVALRLVLLLGRGDYLAFDEGWYDLLGRSLFTGDGYTLIGLPHVALSPLYPILAGAAGWLLDSWVWGGRVVAATASGLLVLPAWSIFRRLAPERTAFIAVCLIAVLPPLAPFVVPFWIGADLWVGAEPLLHLLLYAGIAAWLAADRREAGGPRDPAGLLTWGLSGALFGLAFLARPEAIITWGLMGLIALAVAARRRSFRRVIGAGLMGLAFLATAAPYWVHIHGATGQWALSGRGVSAASGVTRVTGGNGAGGAAGTIERMLWEDDTGYATYLYSLDGTGLRLRAGYWGVQPDLPPESATEPGSRAPLDETPGPAAAAPAGPAAPPGSADSPGRASAGPSETPSPVSLYIRAMGMILPLLLWPFVVLGLAQPRTRAILRRELPVTLSLVGTSLAIAVVVAVDPRTQLFLVPMLAFYAARGFSLVEETLQRRRSDAQLRPGFFEGLLAAVAVLWLLGINGRRLQLSLSLGSPHHIVGAQNRAVAEDLDSLLGDHDGPIASWHPAIAVWADRDWRVLPYSDLPGIVRYLDHVGARAAVLSAYYPPDLGVENLGTRYLVLPIPTTGDERRSWRLHPVRGDSIRTLGRLESVPPDSAAGPGS